MSGFAHTLGTSGITATTTGIYAINFSVSGQQTNQFALTLNGTVVPSGIYGSGAGTQLTVGQLILNLTAGDVIALINHTSGGTITLQAPAGGTQANVDASVVIEQLG